MKAKIVVLSLVALAAGGLGSVAGKMLTAEPSLEQAAAPAQVDPMNAPSLREKDPCKDVIRHIRKGDLTDQRLQKLLKHNDACRAVIMDSSAPAITVSGQPQVVTVSAPSAQVPTTATSTDDDAFERDDDDEGDDEVEVDDDGYSDDDHEDSEGEDDAFENDASEDGDEAETN